MGNQNLSSLPTQPTPIQNLNLTHLGPLTLMNHQQRYCLLKIFTYSDQFLMEDRFRKLKIRTTKLANNPHVLNIYQIVKQERKQLCANNFQLFTYIQYFEQTLKSTIERRLTQRKNYTEEQLYLFLAKIVESLLYIQDNGLKNIHLDTQSILFCGEQVKVLDNGLACSKTYLSLLQHREKGEKHDCYVYLAPQLLKQLQQLNYDPYISPKADIFSLGMLLLEMVALQPMHGYYDFQKLTIDYQSLIHRLSRITHSLPLKTLIAQMLEYDPEERIGLLSLKQKLKKLTSSQEQQITRSKSSKMLQEILSHSRRSSSICKQSENSMSLSRQPSSQKKRINNKISVRCSDKKLEGTVQGNTQLPPFTSRRQEHFQQPVECTSDQQNNLRNLVKNKLNRDKPKIKQNSSRLLRPLKRELPMFAQNNKVLRAKTIFQTNSLQSSLLNKKINSSQRNKLDQNESSLHRLATQSGVQKLLKLEQLQNNSMLRSNQQSLKNTSRFGSTEHNIQEVKQKSISRGAQIYIKQEKEDEYTMQIEEFRISNNKVPEKTLNKVMTFNKEIQINAKSVQGSFEYANNEVQKSLSKLAFSPINSHLNGQHQSVYVQSGYKNITIKDVPVVISQQKVYEAAYPPSHYGNIQRQLQTLQISQSIKQVSSLNSSLNNASKVIEAYRPLDESLFAKAEPLSYQISAPFKKPKSRKPQLMIQLGDQESSPSTMPLVIQPKKSHLQNLYKTTQSIQHLSNFTSISPPQQNKENQFSLNYIKTGFSPQLDEDFSQKITLPDGKQYEGQTLGQLPHGNGVMYSNSKILFSGSFKFGKFHGYGTLNNMNFQPSAVDHKLIDLNRNYWMRFQGEFDEDKMSGFGTVFFAEGQKFSGCLKDGVIEGYGCFYRKNGELVSGLWSQNKFRKV